LLWGESPPLSAPSLRVECRLPNLVEERNLNPHLSPLSYLTCGTCHLAVRAFSPLNKKLDLHCQTIHIGSHIFVGNNSCIVGNTFVSDEVLVGSMTFLDIPQELPLLALHALFLASALPSSMHLTKWAMSRVLHSIGSSSSGLSS
jgi:hypothetical protein